MSFRRWALVVGLIGLALALLLALGPGSVEVAQMGHPDWTTKTEVVNSELYVTVLNSSLDVNVTNTSLDVNVTNSTLNVSVQGTANVEIQNARINVATAKELASEGGNIAYASTQLNTYDYYSDSKTIYTNSGTETVYLEMVTFRMSSGFAQDMSLQVLIKDSTGTTRAWFYAMVTSSSLNFDPAIPLPPGWKIEVYAERYSSNQAYVDVSILIRTS